MTPNPPVQGTAPARLAGRRSLWVFGAALGAAVVVAVIAVGALGPAAPPPQCEAGTALCPAPPPMGGEQSAAPLPQESGVPSTADRYTTGTTWRSSELGFEVDYDPADWYLVEETATSLVLGITDRDGQASGVWILFEGAPAAQLTPDALREQRLGTLRISHPDLVEDSDSYDVVLGGHIGYIDAQALSLGGTGSQTSGLPTTPAGFAVLVASDDRLTVLVLVTVERPDELSDSRTRQLRFRGWADTLLNDFRWGTGP